jgi:hypothetical protein
MSHLGDERAAYRFVTGRVVASRKACVRRFLGQISHELRVLVRF